MAALTTADLSAVEKEVWATDELAKQYEEGTLLLDILDKGDQNAPKFRSMLGTHDGKYIIMPLHTGPNPNAGVGIREGREYPAEGGQSTAQAKYRSKKVGVVRGLTTEVMTRVGGNPQSAVDWAALDAAKTMDNCRRRMDYYLHGDGSGILTSIVSYDNTNSIATVGSTANIFVGTELSFRSKTGGTNSAVFQGTIPVGLANTNSQPYPVKVTAVNNSTAVTVAYASNGTALSTGGDGLNTTTGVFLWDQQGSVPFGLDNVCTTDNPNNAGFNSLATAVNDENGFSRAFGAIDRSLAASAFWQAATATNCASQALSITEHVQVISNTLCARDTSLVNSSDCIFLLPRNAWWQIVNDLESGKRTTPRTKIVDGKYDAIQYDIFTFCFSFQQPASTGYVFAPKYMFRMITTPWQEVTLQGSNYSQILGPVMTRPTDKWRNQLFTEQEVLANSCQAAMKVTNIGT